MRILLLLLLSFCVQAADNTIYIEQTGSGNTFVITQEGTGHSATITTGTSSDVDYSYFTITQQGTGAKLANISMPSGINNTITIGQDGSGNHIANIQNLNGSGNNISISQTGNASHEFNVVGSNGSTNNGNTLNATQSGNAAKWFTLTLNGATGANVTVQQTSNTTPDQASMNINCNSCGNWSYVKF